MTTCEHHCGDPVYRVLGPSFNTRSWAKWLRKHQIPVDQVPINGAWARRDVEGKQVTVLVYDWDEGDDVRPGMSGSGSYVYRDGKGGVRTREFVAHLDRAPDPFPTTSDCGQDGREPAIGGGASRADYYEHRPLQ